MGDPVGSLLAWSGLVRLGGISLVLAGATGVAASVLFAWLSSNEFRQGSYNESTEWIWALADSVGLLGDLLVVAGLVGVYALLSGRLGFVGGLAKVGFLLAVVPTVCYVGLWMREYLTEFYYGPPDGLSFFSVVSYGYGFVTPLGFLLLGAAAVWVRGLGRWRALLPAIALMSTPLPHFLLFALFAPENGIGNATDFLVYSAPQMLADLGWIFLGLAMWNVRNRENDVLADDRRTLERKNLDRARRLYTGVWVEEDTAVLDGLVSPDVVDHGRGKRGREGFERGLTDLRRTFPDLRFEIEAQTAEGDAVVTRWRMSGTDRGGVLWYPPTGREATFTGAFTDRFYEGRLVEHRGEPDMDGLLGQLGLPLRRRSP